MTRAPERTKDPAPYHYSLTRRFWEIAFFSLPLDLALIYAPPQLYQIPGPSPSTIILLIALSLPGAFHKSLIPAWSRYKSRDRKKSDDKKLHRIALGIAILFGLITVLKITRGSIAASPLGIFIFAIALFGGVKVFDEMRHAIDLQTKATNKTITNELTAVMALSILAARALAFCGALVAYRSGDASLYLVFMIAALVVLFSSYPEDKRKLF